MEEIKDLKNKTLLFHHHELVYIDNEGLLWLSSPIGLWLDEMSIYFKKIHLIVFNTTQKSVKHDMYLKGDNFNNISLGAPGNYYNYFSKRNRVKKVCENWSGKCDFFLIRGFTPLQNILWKRVDVHQFKIFYLVRSLKQKRSISLFKPLSIIAFLSNLVRESNFQKILSTNCMLIANSKLIAKELENYTSNKVYFASSNVLSASAAPIFKPIVFENSLHFLFVGRISEMKGIIELLNALSLFKKQTNKSFVMHLVGNADDSFLKDCKILASKLNILENLIFYGRLDFGPKLFSLYKKANLFILPSHSEGFPRVVWEAALFTCPLLITHVGGIPSVFTHKKNAYLIPPKNINALFDALVFCSENNQHLNNMAKQANSIALENTLEKGVEKFIKSLLR